MSSTKLTAVFLYSSSSSSLPLFTGLPTTTPLGSSNRFLSLFKTTRQHWNRNGPRVFALVAIFGGMVTFLYFPFIWERTYPGILIPASVSTFKIDTSKSLNRVFLPTQQRDFKKARPGGKGAYCGSQATGIIEIFSSGIFWVAWFERDFLGIQHNLKIRGSACVSPPRCSVNHNQACFEVVLIAELSRVRKARRVAPWVRSFGNLCIQEILVLRKSSVRRTSLRTSTPSYKPGWNFAIRAPVRFNTFWR